MRTYFVFVLCLGFPAALCGCRVTPDPAAADGRAVEASDSRNADDSALDWTAIEKRYSVVQREQVELQYAPPENGGILRFVNYMATVTVNVEDVIECREWRLKERQRRRVLPEEKDVPRLSDQPVLKRLFADRPQEPPQDKLADRLRAELNSCVEYDFRDFERSDRSDLQFDLMRLLQQGRAQVQSRDGRLCERIFACEWLHDGGPTACAGGMVFFLDDGCRFFHVMTWVS